MPAEPPAPHLYAGPVGLRPHRRRRHSGDPLREARARAHWLPVQGQLRGRTRTCSRRSRSISIDPHLLVIERPRTFPGQRTVPPTDGVCRLLAHVHRVQPCARPGYCVGHVAPEQNGPLRLICPAFRVSRSATQATAGRPATCRSAISPRGEKRAGFTLRNGLICTALSHDIIAHETTHALLDGLRESFMNPYQHGRPRVPRGILGPGGAVPPLHVPRRRRAGDPRLARRAFRAARC